MNLKELCIVELKKGSWTFDVLGPRFQTALIKRVQGENPALSTFNRSMMEWTLMAYRKLAPTEDRLLSSFISTIDPNIQSMNFQAALTQLAEATIDNGFVTAFTGLERTQLESAVQDIGRHAPDTAKSFRRWITHFLKMDGVPFRSASHPHAFGCIFLSSRIEKMSSIELATSIVHEMGHQDLFLLNIIDRLIQQDADYKMAHAPFQEKLRPPIGRLHSYFALYRMIQFQNQVGLDPRRYLQLFNETKASFAQDELTEYGFQIVEGAAQFIHASSTERELQLT
ncbi:MAG: hypothetical protein KF865_03135 [Bdellovibrionaceae bacterium]|nr:hypothetical protein [Pseudobdellovibrionaceae bacterium]